MASTIKVNTLDTQTGTNVTIAAGKKVSGANTQYVVTGGAVDQVLQSDGAGNLTWGGMAGFNTIKFDETPGGSESYTVPTGATQLLVFVTGGGGAGATADAPAEGAGGTAAGTTISLIPVSGGEATTIVIGAGGTVSGAATSGGTGGDTSFAYVSGGTSFSTVIGKGGPGGTYYTTPQVVCPAGTVGATNTGIALLGGMGSPMLYGSSLGGSSFWGGGGAGANAASQAAFAAQAAGSGGGGGISTAGKRNGGVGKDGFIMIMVFK